MKNTKEQGCSLDELSRIQTLKSMGIQPWFSKYSVVQDTEEIQLEEPQTQSAAVIVPAQASEELISEPVVSTSISNFSELNWEQLQQSISQCQLCELHTSRTQTVFGTGKPDADLMIIAEAPNAEEDRLGDSFVGEAGQLLDAMLKAIDLSRDKVFITNILKCCPPDNRQPHTSEIICCDAYLQRQIELVQPKLILAMGRVAAHHLLVTKDALGTLRTKEHNYNGIPLLASYHPAYLLRKPIEKRKSWQDLLKVKSRLKK